MKRIISCALAGLMVSASVAVAAQSVATVQNVGGKVLVNKGKGFVPVTASMTLGAGDTLMIGNKSSATIAYADCTVDLKKPSIVTVTANACKSVKKSADGVFVTPTADVPVAAAAPFPNTAALLIGGAAVVTAVVILSKKSSKP